MDQLTPEIFHEFLLAREERLVWICDKFARTGWNRYTNLCLMALREHLPDEQVLPGNNRIKGNGGDEIVRRMFLDECCGRDRA